MKSSISKERCNKAQTFENQRILMYQGKDFYPIRVLFKAIYEKKGHIQVSLFDVYGFPYFQVDYLGSYYIIVNATHYTYGCIFKFLSDKTNILPMDVLLDEGHREQFPGFILYHLRREYKRGLLSLENAGKDFNNSRYYSHIEGVHCYSVYPRGTLDYGVFPYTQEEMEKKLDNRFDFEPIYPTFKKNRIKLEIP